MYISGYVNNIFNGEFTIGIYTSEGMNEQQEDFYEIVFGFFLFEVHLGKVYENI